MANIFVDRKPTPSPPIERVGAYTAASSLVFKPNEHHVVVQHEGPELMSLTWDEFNTLVFRLNEMRTNH